MLDLFLVLFAWAQTWSLMAWCVAFGILLVSYLTLWLTGGLKPLWQLLTRNSRLLPVALLALILPGCGAMLAGTEAAPGPNTFVRGSNADCTFSYASGAERSIAGLKAEVCGGKVELQTSESRNADAMAALLQLYGQQTQLTERLVGQVLSMAARGLPAGVPAPAVPEAPKEERPQIKELPPLLPLPTSPPEP